MARDAADSKPQAPRVSVILVAYESGPTLALCLEALRAQTFTDFEVILVDNGCSDGAARDAAAADPSIRLVEPGTNLGFAAGVNRAAALARGRHLALINPDAYADPDWLERLIAAASAYPAVRCFASRQLMAEDPRKLDGLGDVMSVTGFPFRGGYGGRDKPGAQVGEVFSACGGAMLIETALFEDLGGFDERLFCYCEDVDLGYRMRLRGEPTLVIPQAVVRHEGSASTGGPRSEFAAYHGTRNRLWVFVKDTPPLLFWPSIPLHMIVTLVLFVSHAIRGEVAAPWRGLMAGLKGLDGAFAARRAAQAARTASTWRIARAMSWSPLDLLFRRVVIRRWRPSPPAGS